MSDQAPQASTIIYTHTDEAPLLATYSFLPIIQAYAAKAGVDVETRDISLAGRILSQFPDRLSEEQRVADHLAELGELATKPEANIIKLPNISASTPQLKAAIKELREQGYDLPDYPESPDTDEEREVRARYDKTKGSAVNPVLREGNSDRRAPASVKAYAKAHPHRMGAWSSDSKTNVATMGEHDFRSNEKSVVIPADDTLRIEHVAADGTATVLKDEVKVLAGEVVDATFMDVAALRRFLTEQIARAKADDVLFSVHLKATMMKVSDPIIFGHAVQAFFPTLFEQYGEQLAAAGISPERRPRRAARRPSSRCPTARRSRPPSQQGLADGPKLAMVDSDKGITNLHVPSDVIIDASMPAMIRTSGHMWGPDGEEADTLAVIPDSSYAGVYQTVIDDCRAHGAFDPATMGSVPNVGLMAKAAEEYGSHDKTFEVAGRRHHPRRERRGGGPARARRAARRHLAGLPDQGRPDPRLGEARRHPRPRLRHARDLLARRDPRPRRQPDRQGERVPARARHRRAHDRDPGAGRRPRRTRWSGSARARTPSRSPATCCATTTPTCSRSSSSAPRPRCCRSCR